jgi:aspartate kinase
MKVYKFGGASIKNAESVRNLLPILKNVDEKLIIVISAMGKITDSLVELAEIWFYENENIEKIEEKLNTIKDFHIQITNELILDKKNLIFKTNENIFTFMFSKMMSMPSLDFDFEYDQIVPFGEILSSGIVSAFFNQEGISNRWVDIGSCLKTESYFRDAHVDWELTDKLCHKVLNFEREQIYVTQGFVGSTVRNLRTTLGREGSDFTGAVLSYILDAESLTVWKDVEGIFNADPKYFKNPVKLNAISYHEAIELAYYGANVIHPKTLKPLQNKNIPLYVKTFLNPQIEGTLIKNFDHVLKLVPIYIFKRNQILVSISPKNFSFIVEENMSRIFAKLAELRIKANLMQNSAISFSICADYDKVKFETFIDSLKNDFVVKYNTDLELITIRHYTKEAIDSQIDRRTIYIQQKSRNTVRFIVK